MPACLFLWDRFSRGGFAQALQGACACLLAQRHPDLLISASEEAAKLYQERRNALISSAVTGQIDVRSLAPKEEVAA